MNETVVSLRNNREIVMSKAKLSLTAYLSMDVYLSSTVNLTFKGRYAITSLFWLLVNTRKRRVHAKWPAARLLTILTRFSNSYRKNIRANVSRVGGAYAMVGSSVTNHLRPRFEN